MKKSDKNIIEAGITPAEFEDIFADDLSMAAYLSKFPSQAHRYGHLYDLALIRGEWEMADYFLDLSGKPFIIDWCD